MRITIENENILAEIKRSGIFILSCRLIMEGKPVYVQIRASVVEEREGPRLIVGLVNIDSQVRQEEEYGKRLAQVQYLANTDALTGIKNKNAFLAEQERLDHQIAEQNQPRFAMVVLDVNDLKKINDTAGHQAGDQYLRDACKIICDAFQRSPVFRIGGDEFTVVLRGNDYDRIEELVSSFYAAQSELAANPKISPWDRVSAALGYALYDARRDHSAEDVFRRADEKMYEQKKQMKASRKDGV